eukprot:10078534-Ditylum_brightwellii.AAC.1
MVELQDAWEQTLTEEEDNVEQIKECTHYFYVDLFNPDKTGKFPFKLSNGSQYALILYDYDSNAILAEL